MLKNRHKLTEEDTLRVYGIAKQMYENGLKEAPDNFHSEEAKKIKLAKKCIEVAHNKGYNLGFRNGNQEAHLVNKLLKDQNVDLDKLRTMTSIEMTFTQRRAENEAMTKNLFLILKDYFCENRDEESDFTDELKSHIDDIHDLIAERIDKEEEKETATIEEEKFNYNKAI